MSAVGLASAAQMAGQQMIGSVIRGGERADAYESLRNDYRRRSEELARKQRARRSSTRARSGASGVATDGSPALVLKGQLEMDDLEQREMVDLYGEKVPSGGSSVSDMRKIFSLATGGSRAAYGG